MPLAQQSLARVFQMECARRWFSICISLWILLTASGISADAGTFYRVSGGPNKMLAADLNHDGMLDVIGAGAGGLNVLLNKGDGTLLPAVTYPDNNGYFLATADFNNDGNLDVVTEDAATGGNIDTLLGNGDGTFQAAKTLHSNCGIDPAGITTGDFNGDGKADLAVGNFGPRKLAILLGKGDGTFLLGSCNVVKVGEIIATDINHDGKIDLVAVNSDRQIAPYGLLSILGNGDGSFQDTLQYDNKALLTSPELADINSDGALDVLAMSAPQFVPMSVLTFLGRGDGTFQKPSTIASTKDFVEAFTVANFDGDGFPDVMIETLKDTLMFSVTFFAGNGDGTYRKGTALPIPSHAPTLIGADLDSDGKTDLIGTLPNSSQIVVFHGNGDGTFQ